MFTKYASASIEAVAPHIGEFEVEIGGPKRLAALTRHVAVSDPLLLDPNRFGYLRIRAVSSLEWWGDNANGDAFEDAELARSFGSFLYCPQYVDHANTDHRKAVGIIVAAVKHPGPKPGGWVQIISAIDRDLCSRIPMSHLAGQPDLFTAVAKGLVTDTSMGCFVEESICSICGNPARDPDQYCPDIRFHKGSECPTPDGLRRAFEVNRGVTFFEDSIITSTWAQGGGGADQTAKILSEIPVTASRETRPWVHLLVDRRALIAQTSKETDMPTRTPPNRTGAAAPMTPDADSARLTVGNPGAVSHESSAPDYFNTGAADVDRATADEARRASPPVGTPQVIDRPDDKLAIQPNPQDHPQSTTASRPAAPARTAEADPSATLGGEPEEVTQARQENEENRLEAVENNKAGEDAATDAANLEEEHAEERDESKNGHDNTVGHRIRSAFARIFNINVRAAGDGVGMQVLADHVDALRKDSATLTKQMASVRNPFLTSRLALRRKAIDADLNQALALMALAATSPAWAKRIDRKAAEVNGNPQALLDIEGYEAGDPDAASADEARAASPPTEQPAVAPTDDQAANLAPADHPQGANPVLSGRKVKLADGSMLPADRADRVLSEIERIMAQEGIPYEQAEEKATKNIAQRTAGAAGPVSIQDKALWARALQIAQRQYGAPGTKLAATKWHRVAMGVYQNLGGRFAPTVQPRTAGLTGRRADLAARLMAAEEPEATEGKEKKPEDNKTESGRSAALRARLGRTVRAEEDSRGGPPINTETEMHAGTSTTLESPETATVADGGEMIQPSADAPGLRPVQPVEGTRRRAINTLPVGTELDITEESTTAGAMAMFQGGGAGVWIIKNVDTSEWAPMYTVENFDTGKSGVINGLGVYDDIKAGTIKVGTRRRAAEDPETALLGGNLEELASPSTQQVSEHANEEGAERLQVETFQQTAPPVQEVLSMRELFARRQMAANANLRRENQRLHAELTQERSARKTREARALVAEMSEKGFFRSEGNLERQRQAMNRKVAELVQMAPAAFQAVRDTVRQAQVGTTVPRFEQTVTMPRQGSLRRPVTAGARPDGDDEGFHWN